MSKITELVQTADWKSEKHVPVIQCSDEVKKDEIFEVRVTLGKEVAHPNTTEHHINWISLYFHPEGAKFPYQVGRVEFSAHGESADGANAGPVYTHHDAAFTMKTSAPGTLTAVSLCNIHGLWEFDKDIKVS